MRVRAVAVFRGRVQGVYFRANCADKADELGLDGYVRNMHDGSVEAVFEGEKSPLETCIDWNRKSQTYARGEAVQDHWSGPPGEGRGVRAQRTLAPDGYRHPDRAHRRGTAVWNEAHAST